jgi:hypothetical protein
MCEEETVATNPVDRNRSAATPKPPDDRGSYIGTGVSPEHRAVLEAALAQRPKQHFYEVLASMPDVGEDSDFARTQD